MKPNNIETEKMIEEWKISTPSDDSDATLKKASKNDYGFCIPEIRDDIIKNSLTTYERDILELADEMASAMTDLNAHNYRNFVDARDKFRDKIKEMCEKTLENHNRVERMKKAVAEI